MREQLINRLQKKLKTLSTVLVKEYDARLLVKYLELEKEIQIQKAYIQNEN